jgi:methylmalonyl-CoA/ethylmalonyl-CoA epimerase
MCLDKLPLNHIAIAVRDFDKSLNFYSLLGYKKMHPEVVRDKLQTSDLIMLTNDNLPNIELVKPYSTKSPVNNYLKENDTVIYHFCYEVKSFDKVINELKKEFRVFNVSEPKPAILFDNKLVAFYYIKGVGLIELLEEPREIL